MLKKLIAGAVMPLGLCMGSAATAGEAGDLTAASMQSDSRPQGDGYRIDHGQGGFALVSHGFWAAPPLAASPAVDEQTATRTLPLLATIKSPTKTGTSSFRRAVFLPHVQAAEARYRLPTGLLDALVWTESRYDPLAVSPAGAAGLGQLMPGTARELGVANRFDPVANISGAARYLRQMFDKFGMVHLAVAAYNAGPGAVERARGIPRNGETPAYVSKVLAFWGFK